MTTVVMEHDGEDHSASNPIMLTLNCNNAAGYLSSENQLLSALLGPLQFERADIMLTEWDVCPQSISHISGPDLVNLLNSHENMSWSDLQRSVEDSAWCIQQVRSQIRKALKKFEETLDPRQRVRLVIISDELLEEGSVLSEALLGYLPGAAFFKFYDRRHGLPQRIWMPTDPPTCRACGTKMRPAGSAAYICEGCGSTLDMSS